MSRPLILKPCSYPGCIRRTRSAFCCAHRKSVCDVGPKAEPPVNDLNDYPTQDIDYAFSKTSADMERYINDAPAYLGFLSHIKKNASKLSPEDLQFVKGLDDELTRVGALLKAYSEKSTGLMTVMSSLLK